MAQPIELAYLVLIFAAAFIVHYMWAKRIRKEPSELYVKAVQEQETFLKTFVLAPFSDFSLFSFYLGRFNFSYVSPFPESVEGQWRYKIMLTRPESEDITTIKHEISECTVARLIENLLNLEKPLYLQRKQHDKFWIHGKKQKYLIEHIITTLSEIDDLTNEELKTRIDKEDLKTWLNP